MKNIIMKMFKGSKEEFLMNIFTNINLNKKTFVVTANPETLMIADENPEFKEILLKDSTTIIADGIGIVVAGKFVGIKFKERIPGIEVVESMLSYLNANKKSAYFLGAKEEVINDFVHVVKKDYPNIKICGFKSGYVEDKDAVFEEIKQASPDCVLVALGIPAQELLIAKHIDDFKKGIFIGVGGTFDCLSGHVKRAPKAFRALHLEWFYRIMSDPVRIKRFYNSNVKFIPKLKKEFKEDK